MIDSGKFRILAVCSGNVCRSPFVELLLGQALAENPTYTVASGGTVARPGQKMTTEMIRSAARFGIDPDVSLTHEATRLDEETVASADLILALTHLHRSAAVELDPRAVRRAFTLKEFARLSASAGLELSQCSAHELVADAFVRRGVSVSDRSLADDDIDDPIGLSQAVYDRVADEIAAAVTLVAARMARAAGVGPSAKGVVPHDDSGAPDLSFAFRRA